MFMSFWMFRRNNSMNPALLVWLVGIPLAACEIYPSIQWIPENPIFLQKDYLMNVKSMSRLNIVCPNPVSILTTVKHNTPKELLFENLWVVTAEGFKACDATLPGSKLLLQCDTPLELKYYTVVFQQYSASATGLEFQTGKEYYFIATSDGTKASLLNKRGGHCDNGLMKLKVYVCHNGHDERCTPRPTTATIPSTSNSKISTEGEQKTTQSENSDNGNGPDNELYVGRQTGENGVSSHAKSEEIRVKCASSMMQVRIKKNLIEEFELRDLQLEDGDACSAGRWESETYFYLEVPFLGCGTKLKENNASLVYNNIVKDRQSKIPHINRLPQLEIPFSCVYKKRGTVSLVSVDVRRPRVMQIIPDDGVGGFTLEMSLYTSEDYLERRRHFPLSVTINEQLYFQVAVDTPDQRLSIIADTCYATPTSNGSVDSRHYIIRNRCPSDKTLQTYPAPAGKDRFSFRAFQFVHSKEKPYIYVHCKVLVCNASDQASSCIRGCGIVPVLKRQRRDTTSVGYSLNEGPIQIVDIDGKILKSGRSMQEEETAINFTEAAFLAVMAIICTLLICGVIYTRQQLTRAQREQNDRTPVPVQL